MIGTSRSHGAWIDTGHGVTGHRSQQGLTTIATGTDLGAQAHGHLRSTSPAMAPGATQGTGSQGQRSQVTGAHQGLSAIVTGTDLGPQARAPAQHQSRHGAWVTMSWVTGHGVTGPWVTARTDYNSLYRYS